MENDCKKRHTSSRSKFLDSVDSLILVYIIKSITKILFVERFLRIIKFKVNIHNLNIILRF
jgi:hypothetical protein